MSPASKTGPKGADGRPVAQNRRARHDYDILDTYEAGHRAGRQRGEVAAGGQGPAPRQLRPGARRRGVAVRHARPALRLRHRLRRHRPGPAPQAAAAPPPDRRAEPCAPPRTPSPWCRCRCTSRTAGPRSTWRWPEGRKRYDKRHAIAARDADMEARRASAARRRTPGRMNDTVRLGRLAGVRVGLNWSLLAMVALVAGGLADNRFPFDAPGYSGAGLRRGRGGRPRWCCWSGCCSTSSATPSSPGGSACRSTASPCRGWAG